MKDIDTPVLICWVLRIVKEVLGELVLLPDVDCVGDMPTLILIGEPTINDCKIVYHIIVLSGQQLRYLNHEKLNDEQNNYTQIVVYSVAK